jgi:Predicted dehydrogenases and related proteins
MKALVIGYGSIGQRHSRILASLGIETAVLSRRSVDFPTSYQDLSEAIRRFSPQYIVIASKTGEHLNDMRRLIELGWKGTVLVEKPLFHESLEIPVEESGIEIYVAYNLRFHPGLLKLKTIIDRERPISVRMYTGQYLPDWRPHRDYRKSYSSKKEEGGGVLRDLSHELDYITWLLGKWSRLTAVGGKFSSLEISGDDCWGVLLETEKCPLVSLQINYLDRPGKREIDILTDQNTYRLDVSNHRLTCNGVPETFEIDRDYSYIKQHEDILKLGKKTVCSFSEGIQVLRMIDAIEKSNKEGAWIWNERNG